MWAEGTYHVHPSAPAPFEIAPRSFQNLIWIKSRKSFHCMTDGVELKIQGKYRNLGLHPRRLGNPCWCRRPGHGVDSAHHRSGTLVWPNRSGHWVGFLITNDPNEILFFKSTKSNMKRLTSSNGMGICGSLSTTYSDGNGRKTKSRNNNVVWSVTREWNMVPKNEITNRVWE
jgi:hypothetical protein